MAVDAPGSAPLLSGPIRVSPGRPERVVLSLMVGVECRLTVEGELAEARGPEVLFYSLWRAGAPLRTGTLMLPALPAGKLSRDFRLGKLEPGRYELRVESVGLGTRKVEREVPRSGKAEWRLKL